MNDTRLKLKDLIVRVLMLEGVQPDDIGDDQPLFGQVDGSLGLDSVDALEIAIHVEEEFGVRIPDDAEGRKVFRSVTTLARHVEASRPPPGAAQPEGGNE